MAASPNRPVDGSRILIMDDEPSLVHVVVDFLRMLGYRVDAVNDGERAVAAYRAALDSGDPYRVVILDLFIAAGMGGSETMGRLAQMDPRVRAVVSSGHAGEPTMRDYAGHGFSANLLKPYRLGVLKETLERLL